MNGGKITFDDWNLSDQIETKDDVIGTLEAIIELAVQENDDKYLVKAIGEIVRSKGMAQITAELDLDRTSLYKSLSPVGNLSFLAIVRALNSLGYKISIQQQRAS